MARRRRAMCSLRFDHFRGDKNSSGRLADVGGYLRPYLNTAASLYPGFHAWFATKTLPGLIRNERSLILVYRSGDFAGFAILKHAKDENKICTFCVLPEHGGNGLGTELMKASLDIFNGVLPGITVAERLHRQFRPLLTKFGFGCPLASFGLYREGDFEYVYDPSRRILPTMDNGYCYSV